MTRLRFVAAVNPPTTEFDAIDDETEVTFVPLEDVWPPPRWSPNRQRLKGEVLSGYTRFREGDILVPKITPTFEAGRSTIARDLATRVAAGTTELHIVRSDRADARYLNYCFQSKPFLRGGEAAMVGVAGQKRVPEAWLLDYDVPVDELSSQRRIADFLDAETARIDALIEKKQRMIGLLRERFVTARRFGFDSSLSRFGVITLRRCVRCLDGRRTPLNAEERAARPGPYPYWGAGTIVDWIDDYLFDEPLVLLGEDGAPFFDRTRDVAFYVDERVWVNNHIHVLRPNTDWSPRFLMHMLNAVDFSRYITGSTRDKLTQTEMDGIRLPAAPPAEQKRIAAELDASLETAEAVRGKLDQQITLLREHRQALITAAVTGQIDLVASAA